MTDTLTSLFSTDYTLQFPELSVTQKEVYLYFFLQAQKTQGVQYTQRLNHMAYAPGLIWYICVVILWYWGQEVQSSNCLLASWSWEESSTVSKLFYNCPLFGVLHLCLKHLVLATVKIPDQLDCWSDWAWHFLCSYFPN